MLAVYRFVPFRVYLTLTPVTPVLFVFRRLWLRIFSARPTTRKLLSLLFPRSWSMWSTCTVLSYTPVANKIAIRCRVYPPTINEHVRITRTFAKRAGFVAYFYSVRGRLFPKELPTTWLVAEKFIRSFKRYHINRQK